MKKNLKKNNVVEVNGRIIESEVEGSKNVIAFFDDGKRIIIWTNKGEPIRIFSKDLDDFITSYTWGYQNGYARTKVAVSKLSELCERYGWDMEAFDDMDSNTKQVNIYIHRYVMGMFHTNTRKKLKEDNKHVMKEYGLSSINDMHVDHDINKSTDGKLKTDNYSDSMRIVPPPVNIAYRVKLTEAYTQKKIPIVRNDKGVYQMTLCDDVGTNSCTIEDTDAAGRNISTLQMELLKLFPSEYVLPLGIYRAGIVDINKNIEQFSKKKAELHNNLMSKVLLIARRMETEGLLLLKAC